MGFIKSIGSLMNLEKTEQNQAKKNPENSNDADAKKKYEKSEEKKYVKMLEMCRRTIRKYEL